MISTATLLLAAILTLGAAQSDLTDGKVELVADGFGFTEGPVWMPGKGFLFTDGGRDTIHLAPSEVFRKPSGNPNGLALDHQGRLLVCEAGNRRVTRTEKDGTVTVVASHYHGKRFNMPNDLVARSDGTIFFTDPGPWGTKENNDLDFVGFFAVKPDGTVLKLDDGFDFPNGIALSPDEKTLYMNDTRAHELYAYDLAADGTVSRKRTFAELENPDGMVIDKDGTIWCTAQNGVEVYQPDGTHLGTIAFPQQPANCTLGGKDNKTLFATARTAVYQVRVK